MIIIELGCGREKEYPNSIGVDINPDLGADVVCDVERGLPFKDNYADMITSSHFMEHVRDFGFLMREIHRVLKDGGKLRMILPYHSNHRSYFPHHYKTGFSWVSITDYFLLCNEYDGISFRLMKDEIVFMKGIVGKIIGRIVNSKPYYYDRFLSFVFPASELHVEAVKSERHGMDISLRKKGRAVPKRL